MLQQNNNLNAAMPEYTAERLKVAGYFFEEDLIEKHIAEEVLQLVPEKIAEAYEIVPLFEDSGVLVVVTSSDQTRKDSRRLSKLLGRKINILKGKEENVQLALQHYYKISIQQTYMSQDDSSADIDSSPLKQLINTILQDAAQAKASDIHMRPTEEGMAVEFRINGRLFDCSKKYRIGSNEMDMAVNIIKSKDESNSADVSNVKMPDAGSFKMRHGETEIHVRLSTVPLASGYQKVNLRLLPQKGQIVKLDALGYAKEDLKIIRKVLLQAASGMFIISGQTGAGKTTSIYAQIQEILDVSKRPLNVMTIEDPVEVYNSKFSQIQVRESETEEFSLTAPKILKVCLRQDPNLILYGEIRDKLDATVALEAAETGHKVFSTVHAKDCVTTISRLLNLGISKNSLLSQINMILSQKLIGILCPECSLQHTLTEIEKEILGQEDIRYLMGRSANLRERAPFEKRQNCPHCRGTGYTGRTVVSEYIIFDTQLRDAFLDQNMKFADIEMLLKKKNFRSMWSKALEMMYKGRTDIMEALVIVGKKI